MTRSRYRVPVVAVSTTAQRVGVPSAPPRGRLVRLRATMDPTVDEDATPGSGSPTDLALALCEGGTPGSPAYGMGGPLGRSIPWTKPLGTSPGTTLDLDPLAVDYCVPAGEDLLIAVAVDSAPAVPDGILVLTLTIETD